MRRVYRHESCSESLREGTKTRRVDYFWGISR